MASPGSAGSAAGRGSVAGRAGSAAGRYNSFGGERGLRRAAPRSAPSPSDPLRSPAKMARLSEELQKDNANNTSDSSHETSYQSLDSRPGYDESESDSKQVHENVIGESGATCAHTEGLVAGMTLSDMPPELLQEVLARLPCRADRVRLACCSKLWKNLVQDAPEPIQLPWLLLPSTTNPMFYSTTGKSLHRLSRIPFHVRTGNIFGSTERDWIFLSAGEEHWHEIFNLRTGRRIVLPLTMMFQNTAVSVSIRSAVLSDSPDSGNAFTVGAIVSLDDELPLRAAIWKGPMHQYLWEDLGHFSYERAHDGEGYQPLDTELVDVVHCWDTFLFLTSEEEVIKFIPDDMICSGLQVKVRSDFEEDESYSSEEEGGQYIFRYLVGLNGEVLMVVRYVEGHWTVKVRLFRLQTDRQDIWNWVETSHLLGHILFVGHGVSRAYRSGHEAFRIYFFHDRRSKIQGTDLYWRDDNGIATACEVFERPLPMEGIPLTSTSDRAPPSWLLH